MNVNQIAERYKNELPGYKLVGYTELGFPVFQCILHCLMLTDAQIPVVEEFVLNFYNQGVELEEIAMILGLDFDLIEEAWTGLLQRDYINPVTKEISSSGTDYLDNHKIDKLEKTSIQVSIDGLTGVIKPKSSQLMASKNTKKLGIRTLRTTFDKPEIENIDFIQVKNVVKEYQKIDKDNYNGRILEIYNLENHGTKYKRLCVLVYTNNENNVRLLVYDGFERIEGYENALLQLENRGISVFKFSSGDYFESDKHSLFDALISKSSEENNMIGPGNVWELCDNYIETASKDLFLVIPLMDICTPTLTWIGSIEKALNRGVTITLVVSGREFISSYQKEQFDEIVKMKKKNRNLRIFQIPEYYSKILIGDASKGIISRFTKYPLSLNSSTYGIGEQGYLLNQQEIVMCQKLLPSISDMNYKKPASLIGIDNKWLNEKMVLIKRLVSDFDCKLSMINNSGWVGEGLIPDTQALQNLPLAKNHELFKTFINSINRSLIEALEINGKSHGIKDYFWTTIKNDYPDLHHILHKIKVYRNKADHLVLDTKNTELYHNFLQEDLDGRMPEFIDNGFLILQVKIINELELNINKLL